MVSWFQRWRISYIPRVILGCKYVLILTLFLASITYVNLKARLSIHHQQAEVFYQLQASHSCERYSPRESNNNKLILFWTKIFDSEPNIEEMNNYLSNHCRNTRCQLTRDRRRACDSDALIFHARGGIRPHKLPRYRSPEQRYVLLTKEPPYKTTAIVGHLNKFFNWTATYRRDSDIDYSYFRWREKKWIENSNQRHSFLNNRRARAAVMISNCFSQNNREGYLKRLETVIPVTRVGFCSWNKCKKNRHNCLDELADNHPFYLAFENSLCKDYATEKYANTILNGRMVPIVFAKDVDVYIPNSFINANSFPTPEDLGQFLKDLIVNETQYDEYFKWKNHYELTVPNDNDFLCELCEKLHDSSQPPKTYESMKKWLYEDAHCQRWVSNQNANIELSVEKSMDYFEW